MGRLGSEVVSMPNKFFPVAFFIFMQLIFADSVYSKEKTDKTRDYFDVNLNGYNLYVLDNFVEQIQNDKVTSLAKIFLEILRREQQWVFEPRVYVKETQGYVHIVKKNGLNVIYHIKKENGQWKIINKQEKVFDSIPVPKEYLKEVLIERLLDDIEKAVESYYGRKKLWYRGFEQILRIEKDETKFEFYVTVRVTTFEGAHNPPYGEETMTFRIKGGGEVELIDYRHRNSPNEELSKLKVR